MHGWTDWMGTPRAIAQRLTFATAAGVFLGLIGPFGSYDVPAAVRVLGWTLNFWAGALLLSVAFRAAERISVSIGAPLWFTLAAATVAASAPLAGIAATVFRLLRPSINLSSPAEFYLQTLAIAAPFALGYVAFSRRFGGRSATGPTAATVSPASSFLARLPPALGRDLLALQMEDHYVRAHTPRGSELILIPLRQAVDELAGVEGLRVHRSWWVARAAVEGAQEDGRNLRLTLRGGLSAPVARSAVAAVREAGWLHRGGRSESAA